MDRSQLNSSTSDQEIKIERLQKLLEKTNQNHDTDKAEKLLALAYDRIASLEAEVTHLETNVHKYKNGYSRTLPLHNHISNHWFWRFLFRPKLAEEALVE